MRARLQGGTQEIDAVVLDCDGVVFDVNPAKTEALRLCVEGSPPTAVEELVRHHLEYGGVSRYVKLERFFTELHAVDDVTGAVAGALERFATASRAAYERLEPHPGALSLLDRCARSPWIVSGSDQEELRDVFEHKGLTARFAEVCGSPVTKSEHLSRILGDQDLTPGRTLFIGDGRGDHDAARSSGLPFVWLGEMSEWTEAPDVLAREERVAIAPTWDHLLEEVLA